MRGQGYAALLTQYIPAEKRAENFSCFFHVSSRSLRLPRSVDYWIITFFILQLLKGKGITHNVLREILLQMVLPWRVKNQALLSILQGHIHSHKKMMRILTLSFTPKSQTHNINIDLLSSWNITPPWSTAILSVSVALHYQMSLLQYADFQS